MIIIIMIAIIIIINVITIVLFHLYIFNFQLVVRSSQFLIALIKGMRVNSLV